MRVVIIHTPKNKGLLLEWAFEASKYEVNVGMKEMTPHQVMIPLSW